MAQKAQIWGTTAKGNRVRIWDVEARALRKACIDNPVAVREEIRDGRTFVVKTLPNLSDLRSELGLTG